MPTISSKTIARIAAVQALYQYHLTPQLFNNSAQLVEAVKKYYQDEMFLEDLDLEDNKLKIKLNYPYFNELVTFAINNTLEIDTIIKNHLSKEWNFENLHLNLQAILRAGLTELKYFPETPKKVIINEYTNLAADMLKPQEVGFVNSLLDTINKELQ